MTAQLHPFTVRLHNDSEDIKGHIAVQATSAVHAGQVAVAQTIDISYPESTAGQWVVAGVEVQPCAS